MVEQKDLLDAFFLTFLMTSLNANVYLLADGKVKRKKKILIRPDYYPLNVRVNFRKTRGRFACGTVISAGGCVH